MSATVNPVECSSIKEGNHIILSGRPCKIVEVNWETWAYEGNVDRAGCFDWEKI